MHMDQISFRNVGHVPSGAHSGKQNVAGVHEGSFVKAYTRAGFDQSGDEPAATPVLDEVAAASAQMGSGADSAESATAIYSTALEISPTVTTGVSQTDIAPASDPQVASRQVSGAIEPDDEETDLARSPASVTVGSLPTVLDLDKDLNPNGHAPRRSSNRTVTEYIVHAQEGIQAVSGHVKVAQSSPIGKLGGHEADPAPEVLPLAGYSTRARVSELRFASFHEALPEGRIHLPQRTDVAGLMTAVMVPPQTEAGLENLLNDNARGLELSDLAVDPSMNRLSGETPTSQFLVRAGALPPRADVMVANAFREAVFGGDLWSTGVIELDLGSEQLGKVGLSVNMLDGQLQVALIAGQPEALELMRRSVGLLIRELQAQGYHDVKIEFAGRREDLLHNDLTVTSMLHMTARSDPPLMDLRF